MKRHDDTPVDQELAAWLEAIDATLAGEPVEPRYAESAELALLLADDRPRPGESFAAALDASVQRRFAPDAAASGGAATSRRWRVRSHLVAGGFAAACLAAVVAVVVVLPGTRSPVRGSNEAKVAVPAARTPTVASAPSAAPAPSAVSPSSSTGGSGAGSASPSPLSSVGAPGRSSNGQGSNGQSSNPSGAGAPATQSLQLPPNGRKVIQSAQLDLSAPPDRIDAVAQELFGVVGAADGIVDRSTVTQTGGLDGHASFTLRLPSATVGQAMNRLSALRNARVLSRTDSSQDVNRQYLDTTRALTEARALRTALLKRLANAATTAEIDSLKAQIHDADSSIAADQAAVNALNSKLNYTQVAVTITARAAPTPVHHGSGGFTLGRAGHVAGRVLVVAAGVALIALSALVPVGLVTALLIWIATALRRRRREQALDAA